MDALTFVLLLAAFVLLLLAAAGVTLHPRLSLLALGLALWVLVPLLHAAANLG